MRRAEQVNQLREGVVGVLAPATDPPQDRLLTGLVKLDENAIVAKLVADDDAFDDERLPIDAAAVGGSTEAGDILLVDLRTRGDGPGQLRVAKYTAHGVLVEVDLTLVDADHVAAVQFAYHGLHNWLPERIYKDDPLIEDGKLVGWSAELRYAKGITVPLDDGFTLRFSTGWNVGGEFDRRTFATPLNVTVESKERRSIREHIGRLDAVHALLNIAHRERVQAFGGSARLTEDSDWCAFWETTFMSKDGTHDVAHFFPYFGLDEIGGITAVARWIDIARGHRRAVTPVVRHVLEPSQTPEARLLSTAAAMESWIAAHRRSQAWAKKVENEDLPGAIIRTVDPSWNDWIGDSDEWLRQFWASYNHVKHRPEDDLDPNLVNALEIAGRWLLTAAVLDKCAGNMEPSRHLFGTSLGVVGGNVRGVLGTSLR
ncbi:hypothetical protein GGQ22_11540 [Nocardioides sp. zg-579]|uniref:ApeA N-terminal domain-containing protein n=1 Tax=Nocardioides marmotae TaxID=2663857 RepID=A0A6I3JCD5_9ACTN|nr:hypothetical protein [Nocardioides marmotae]MCR6032075.1 hypothetical protein [Gordonia jinghuaiqii]MTB95719.1 hypothetical protein [Nocardioides marmotae]QKE01120.1 hypothetical protein HPC71_08600 [Nocardioides marmotae]